MDLKNQFFETFSQFGLSETEILPYWKEVETAYSIENRHYHTMEHLLCLLNELSEIKNDVRDWNTLMFTLYYHDIIYSSISYKNELKSAELAAERLRDIGVSEDKIEKCRDQILATKHHKTSEDMDTNYFLDADLAILGTSEEKYRDYRSQIRKEYKMVPRWIYRKGRVKLVKKFLSMDRIYKTEHFHEKYEEKARVNLTSELKLLQ